MAEQTLNLPQTLVFLIILVLSLRWYFSKPSRAQPQATANRGFRVNPQHVEQLQQMFPQLDRREIMWDLQRNGGNVGMTTERVLSGRGLETPPPSFQPPLPRTTAAGTGTASRTTTTSSSKPAHPDLITRYNLSSKLNSKNTDFQDNKEEEAQAPKKAWSADKNERQKMLQRRREEMILAARRKMEEKERAKKSATGS